MKNNMINGRESLDNQLAYFRGIFAKYVMSETYTHQQYSLEDVKYAIEQLQREIYFNSRSNV